MKQGLTALVAAATLSCAPLQPRQLLIGDRAGNSLDFLYTTITRKAGVEFAACVEGHVAKDTIYADKVSMPAYIYAAHDSVMVKGCDDEDYVGFIHSHPPNDSTMACGLSVKDATSYVNDHRAYFHGVVCREGYILYFTRSQRDNIQSQLDSIKGASE